MPRLNPLAARVGWLVTITNPQASQKCSKKVLPATNSRPFSHHATQSTMKTPITDTAWRQMDIMTWSSTAQEMRNLARKLELDRAALMEALELAQCMTLNLITDAKKNKPWHPHAASNLRSAADAMQTTLSAARANFPD